MKVLIISSSPRKDGNSEVIYERFAKGASESGHGVEMLLLRKVGIAPCRACYACMETHICAILDNMKEVFQKLEAALKACPQHLHIRDLLVDVAKEFENH